MGRIGGNLLPSRGNRFQTDSHYARQRSVPMSDLVVTNWFGDLVSHPKVIVEANSAEEIIAVLKDPVKYPSPVRAVGSNHSTSPCGIADGGTLIRMATMNAIQITADTVTAQAGAIYIDIAQELEAPATVLREYRNRQPLGRKRGVLRHQRCLHAGRIRPGEL